MIARERETDDDFVEISDTHEYPIHFHLWGQLRPSICRSISKGQPMKLRKISTPRQYRIQVPPGYLQYVEAAIIRLCYLRPQWSFCYRNCAVEVEADVPLADVTRELMHAIYREKVYTETLPLRRELLAMLAKA